MELDWSGLAASISDTVETYFLYFSHTTSCYAEWKVQVDTATHATVQKIMCTSCTYLLQLSVEYTCQDFTT